MSPDKLRQQILPANTNNIYVRLSTSDELAGNVFAARWEYKPGHQILWITQLCVSSKYRNQGIAKKMLDSLRDNEEAVGILSSHPFAVLAVLRVFGHGSEDVESDLEMTKENAREIMGFCPVGYVQEAKLREEGEDVKVKDGVISCADTGFWVDHQEPLAALKTLKDEGRKWHLGDLPEGHEYLVIVRGINFEESR
jgi:predicted GNAT family acetyltransferase